MALDRQSIEKQDFPLGSHGYDPQAVDGHLSRLADEIAEFKSAARRRSETLASSASEQVRAIIDAAETSALEMQRVAEAEAREIREEAQHEARITRERATEDVRDHVSRVSEATAAMLGRLDGMETELSGLIESLRGGATRLDGDLRELEAELGRVDETARPSARTEFRPDPAPVADAPEESWESDTGGTESWESGAAAATEGREPGTREPGTRAEGTSAGGTDSWDAGPSSSGWDAPAEGDEGAPVESHEPESPSAASEPVAEGEAPAAPGPATFPDRASAPPGEAGPAPYGEPSAGSFGAAPGVTGGPPEPPHGGPLEEADDSEGARLIALNMALNGSPREETSRYLSENFKLSDREGLLDEVYASVEG